MNPLGVLLGRVLLGLWLGWVVRALRTAGRAAAPPAWVAVTVAAVLVAYSVARNVPAWAAVLAP
jgi:NhaP-type Na+/H+ or K+/H+ antiporter